MKSIIILIATILILTSCEDVIEIDLQSVEPKIVIEGAITSNSEKTVIKLSKTDDYFEPGAFPVISSADVVIRDENNNIFQFTESEPGTYISTGLKVTELTSYSLEVNAENQIFKANVVMPEKVNISEITYIKTPQFMEMSGGYLVNAHLIDPAGYDNYYRFKVYCKNDSARAGKTIQVFDDAFVDGKEMMMQWDKEQFFPGDTVVVELHTLDKSTYNYYLMLSNLRDNSFIGSATPANPKNNISNGAMGYFGAYSISYDTIIIIKK